MSIVQRILQKVKSLPPLDDTILKIQRICSDKNSSLAELSKVVESDPVLTANILKSANSPLYGFSREIKNPSQAISLFGMATIRGFALASALKQSISIDLTPYNNMNPQHFLDISNLQSVLAFKWYGQVNRTMLEIIQPAAFMLEVGKIIIANEIIEQKNEATFKEQFSNLKTPLEVSNLEKIMVGISNEEITAKIFEQWNLEADLGNSILHSNNPFNSPPTIQKYAIALNVVKNSINFLGTFRPNGIQESYITLDKAGLKREQFDAVITHMQQH